MNWLWAVAGLQVSKDWTDAHISEAFESLSTKADVTCRPVSISVAHDA